MLILIFFILATRLPFLINQSIPFSFDHGKDSLAILDMWLNLDPKFVGPWTSIPGLYFGPAWYYLLLPFYIIGGGHPLSPVFVMVLLLILQVILVKKFFGMVPAIIMASCATSMTLSLSAWNPFPMTFLSFGILIILKIIKQKVQSSQDFSKKETIYLPFLLGMLASLGFHFSAAFAIFYPILIFLSLLKIKPKFTWKRILFLGLGFTIPFIPQILFEFKNNFGQTKAVLTYFSQGEPHQLSIDKVKRVFNSFLGETELTILPNIWLPQKTVSLWLNRLGLIILGFALIQYFWFLSKKQPAGDDKSDEIELEISGKLLDKNGHFIMRFELITWTLIPFIGFLFLHYNYWYMLAILPVYILFTSYILSKIPKCMLVFFCFLMLLSPLTKVLHYYAQDKMKLAQDRSFLPIKLEAIQTIRQRAGGKAFASYHYVPDIYDFQYQYIYFWQALQGSKLPVEFSYQPNTSDYVVQKSALLDHFDKQQFSQQETEVIFYIVEKPIHQNLLENWWNHQDYSRIVAEIKISPEVTVYEARP